MSEAPAGYSKLFALIPCQKYAHLVQAVKKGAETCKMAFLCPHPQPALPRAGASYWFLCFSRFRPVFLSKPHSDAFGTSDMGGDGHWGQRCGHHHCPLVPTRLVAPKLLLSLAHTNAFPLHMAWAQFALEG